MGAPAGNQFWMLRSKHGRDKLFQTPTILWEAVCEYFQWCTDNPLMEVEQAKATPKPYTDDKGNTVAPSGLIELPRMRPFTIHGLCRHLGCNTKYFNDFRDSLKDKTDELSKDFSEVIQLTMDILYEQKFSGAAAGFLNANIISRDLGLSDKSELVGKGDTELFKEKSDDELLSILKEITNKLDEGK